ncbi:MAG: peptidylprolyl isomerase [Thermoplasmatota archaeon]
MSRLSPPVSLTLLAVLLVAGCLGGSPTTTPTTTVTSPTPLSGTACPATPEAAPAGWPAATPHVLLNTTQGDITLALALELAPVTAGNFLNLTAKGFYDGIKFHRVAANFVIQGGDPNTISGAPSTWGSGGPGYKIPDEFNPTLRHDGAGVVSMATAGPDTGGSQFFVTLAATPNLDDRHSVFAHVVSGMDVVQKIGKLPTTPANDGRPTPDVTITKATILPGDVATTTRAVGAALAFPAKTTEPGHKVTFALVVENKGNARDNLSIGVAPPTGWDCTVENTHVLVPAADARLILVSFLPPANAAKQAYNATFTVASGSDATKTASATATITVGSLGAAAVGGSQVTANYVGLLPDGRVFDTSVGADAVAALPKMATSFHPRAAATFDFQVGGQVIPGFSKLATGARQGETVVGRIDKHDAYFGQDMYQNPLASRDLVFELQMVKVS